MSLLREVQQSLLDGGEIGPILFKLRYLASRLGSDPLEEWVKHESEGYPDDAELPEYRKVNVAYTATFSGAFGSGVRNAPIPLSLIAKFAGKQWVIREMRQSLSAIEDLIRGGKEEGPLLFSASDLILRLQGNVYEDLACNSVTGMISRSSFTEIQNAVRSRVLELTLKLEKSIPAAAEITLGPLATTATARNAEAVTQITQQIVYGDVTTISSKGDSTKIVVNIGKGDSAAFVQALADAGIAKSDATELAEIIASEAPEGNETPFGKKAKAWLAKNISKAVDGTWKVGMDVATKVLTEAAMRYYGFN